MSINIYVHFICRMCIIYIYIHRDSCILFLKDHENITEKKPPNEVVVEPSISLHHRETAGAKSERLGLERGREVGSSWSNG